MKERKVYAARRHDGSFCTQEQPEASNHMLHLTRLSYLQYWLWCELHSYQSSWAVTLHVLACALFV